MAKRLFGRDEHAPSERHKSDFEKAVLGDEATLTLKKVMLS